MKISVFNKYPNQGKTTLALGLAAAYAMRPESSVVLIDADDVNEAHVAMMAYNVRPGVAKPFKAVTLDEYLREPLDAEYIIVDTAREPSKDARRWKMTAKSANQASDIVILPVANTRKLGEYQGIVEDLQSANLRFAFVVSAYSGGDRSEAAAWCTPRKVRLLDTVIPVSQPFVSGLDDGLFPCHARRDDPEHRNSITPYLQIGAEIEEIINHG